MKRALSLLLAAMLLVGLVPAVSAAGLGEDIPQSYHYQFSYKTFGLTASTSPNATNQTLELAEATGYSDPFVWIGGKVASNNFESNYQRMSGYLDNSEKYGDVYLSEGGSLGIYNPDVGTPRFLHFYEIKVGESGWYRPALEYLAGPDNSKVEVYLAKKADGASNPTSEIPTYVRNNIAASDFIGAADLYGAETQSTAVVSSTSFAAQYLEAGSYYLALIASGSNESVVFNTRASDGALYFYNEVVGFRLDGAAAAENTSTVLEYDLSSDAFLTGPADLEAEVPEGYLAFQGADSSSNTNRTAYGWVGSDTQRRIRNVDAIVDGAHINYDNTLPWNGTYISAKQAEWNYNGYTEYISEDGLYINIRSSNVANMYYILELNVPYPGEYKLELSGQKFLSGPKADIYLFPAQNASAEYVNATAFENETPVGTFNFYDSTLTYNEAKPQNAITTAEALAYKEVGTVTAPVGGVYYFVLKTTGADEGTTTYTSGSYTYYSTTLCDIRLTKTADVTYAIDTEYSNDKTVDVNNGTEESHSETVNIVVSKADISGNAVSGVTIDGGTGSYDIGESVTVTAPGKSDDGKYIFRYWKMGGIVVSEDEEYTFNAATNSKLTAVYAKAPSAEDGTFVEFFNGDGTSVSASYVTEESITTPAAPGLVGGTFTGWKLPNGKIYGANETVAVSGSGMAFVAQYDDAEYTVSSNIGEDVAKTYGEEYTVTASSRSGSDMFAYWKKNGEIVSFDKSYTFTVTGDTELEAVYSTYVPDAKQLKKILIGESLDGAIVAEFIGIENAIEKGIIFGNDLSDCTVKAPMKTGSSLFILDRDDVSGTAIGYAILSNGKVIYSK